MSDIQLDKPPPALIGVPQGRYQNSRILDINRISHQSKVDL